MKWDTSVPVCNLNQEIVSYKDGLDKHSYSRPDHHLYGYSLQLSISNLVLHMNTSHIMYFCIVNGIFIQVITNTVYFFTTGNIQAPSLPYSLQPLQFCFSYSSWPG